MVNPPGGFVSATAGNCNGTSTMSSSSKPPSMPLGSRRSRALKQRPFYATVFIFTLLAVYCLYIRGPLPASSNSESNTSLLQRRAGEDCRRVHDAADKCDFVRRNCADDEAGLIQYLEFYYCDLGQAKPVAFIILMVWLGMLFTTIGIAASDFFSINLSTIATILGLSESLAGVTFLAFGNGSPDVFSTFAAMSSNSGSMAVGELIGAAGFITAVVAGSMALVREFKVMKATFLRDVLFFLVAVSFTMGFLSDGYIYLWECISMVIFYAFYVVFVVIWHAYETRKNSKDAKEIAARSHYSASSDDHGNDEFEPYRDDPDGIEDGSIRQRPPMHASHASVDIGVLERGPRIDVESANSNDDYDRAAHIAAEMTSSMRVNRPRGARSSTTIAPIRPSLIGALEFRSVLASLQQEGNMPMRPLLYARSHSHDASGSVNGVYGAIDASQSVDFQARRVGAEPLTPNRDRALSSGNVPLSVDPDLISPGRSPNNRSRATSTHTVGGMLAPPPADPPQITNPVETNSQANLDAPTSPTILRLQIPSALTSEQSSPATSPFPRFVESPMLMTPNPDPGHLPRLELPTPSLDDRSGFISVGTPGGQKPVSWWPYRILPPPHVLISNLFPTLMDWESKNLGSKVVSVLSVPSVFFLVITLPVVESGTTDDEPDEDITEHPASGHMGNIAPPVSSEPNAHIEHETEWDRYRRRRRPTSSSQSIPPLIEIDESGPPPLSPSNGCPSISPSPVILVQKPASDIGIESSIEADDASGWNRWLLILQIFTGPLFCVTIVWANILEDLDRPAMVLLRALMGSLVVSLVLLGVLLTLTTAERRPKYHFLFCFLGFCISIAWISTIAGEVVGVLKAFGVILNISEAILGLTVFAVGNSVGDLVADITVARLGYSVMALSACFGGPLLNILLGIGLGGAYQIIQSANKRQRKHPEHPLVYKPYHIDVSGTLMISAITLLITLIILIVLIPYNKWIMSRKIGFFLIGLWSVSTILNLIVEVTGLWQNVS